MDFALDTLGSKVRLLIKRNTNGTKPVLPYIDYTVGTKTQMGGANRGLVDSLGDSKVKINKDAIVSLRGHGTLSEDIDRLLEDIETLKYFGGS